MNFKSVLNDVCCDNRIKSGVIDLKNADHVFVLQEYLEKAGFDIETIVNKTAQLFEAGRFPERQAYNKDGILVTFPNKEYRDRAINKGTHFAENPKKGETNIFTQPSTDIEQKSEEPKGAVPIDVELQKKANDESEDSYEDRTPKQKVIDAQSVDYILTGETPLVNYSVDEAKRYGFYKKGLIWYDAEGNLIGEQVFDELNNKPLIKLKKEVNLSTVTTKALKKISILDKQFAEILQILKTGGVDGKDDTFKTDIYETLPLLVLYNIELSNANKLGNDSIPRAVDFLTKIGNFKKTLESIADPVKRQENIKIYDAVVNALYEIGGKDGASLKDITSKTPTDFIHKSIEEFYKIAKKYDEKFAGSEKSKKNTADVVIIYGGNKNDVYTALNNGEVENAGESIVKIKNKDIYFALVSLKAMSGRIGRVFTQLRDYLDADVEIQPSAEYQKSLTEGYVDTVKNTFNNFINKYKEISDAVKGKYRALIDNFSKLTGGFIDKIKTDLFTKLNQEVNVLEKNSFKELKNIEDNIQKEFESLNEKKSKMCGTTSAELTPSLIKNIQDYEKLLSATNADTVLIEKIVETSNNPSVTKYFKFEIDDKNLMQIKELKNNVKSISKQIVSSKQSCISREELSPILMYRSNILALQYIDLIMKKVLQDTNLSNPDKIQEEFLNLASVLSTEAIFGGNVSLPLIKYTGNKLERLGYKNEFKIKVPETIPDLKLGKLTVRLEPESNAYMVIYLYLFFGIETGDDKVTPTYVVYEMRNESGSSFTFKVEGNKIVNKI
jgi:hypothetical protein